MEQVPIPNPPFEKLVGGFGLNRDPDPSARDSQNDRLWKRDGRPRVYD
jgi:hypothetical protein